VKITPMHYLITIFFLFLGSIAFSQKPPPPPVAAAVADSSYKPIIMEVVKSCHYELYYEYYKDSIIDHYANKYNWNKKKVKAVKKKLIYKPTSEFSYYNAYAFDSKTQLKNTKEYNLALNKKQLKNLESLHNDMIIHNMIGRLNRMCEKAMN
jgi:hypothetical protein